MAPEPSFLGLGFFVLILALIGGLAVLLYIAALWAAWLILPPIRAVRWAMRKCLLRLGLSLAKSLPEDGEVHSEAVVGVQGRGGGEVPLGAHP